MKVGQKRFLGISIGVLAMFFFIAAFYYSVPEPPTDEIAHARQALAMAHEQSADVYAKVHFKEANRYYDSAMVLWQNENERFILFRNYDRVKELATVSIHKSEEAVKLAKSYSYNLEKNLKKRIGNLNSRLEDLGNTFSRFPLPVQIRENIAKGRLLFSESQVAYQKSNLPEADKKISAAEKLVIAAHNQAHILLNNYFENHNQWKAWMQETIKESKQKNTPVIIVDKFDSKCYVYKNGRQTAEFDAELGKNWVGDKRHKGDFTTPEGRYHVTQKKEGSATKYYKALLINYPNEDDKNRFSSAIANGNLPRNMKIGGLIEIHGHGGKGTDWTEGCVALTNSDMDKLYKMVNVGTPVTIIGSVVSLNEILKR